MTYQVKKNIVMLISSILIFGVYSWFLFQEFHQRSMESTEMLVFFATGILILIPINIAATIVIHILFNIINTITTSEKEPSFTDELDKIIELKALKIGHFIFIIGFVIALLSIVWGASPTLMFIILYVSGFISDISGNITSLYLYSKGV
ncbi:hypothetical protein D8M04_11495 [Oceanobacillus piezotolerans]|uniref:Uncharacterized protein n=1 Tax=Oceanobacillus piezotolerans TaxID=2448030 RepID=A0A498DEP4_9BACI|nr:hypothetical protein [Oceanobacillus piezotolerans]RLL45464.1 hypothetical protein D8M04_11495 [Oceanobacillus piezotolerans]